MANPLICLPLRAVRQLVRITGRWFSRNGEGEIPDIAAARRNWTANACSRKKLRLATRKRKSMGFWQLAYEYLNAM